MERQASAGSQRITDINANVSDDVAIIGEQQGRAQSTTISFMGPLLSRSRSRGNEEKKYLANFLEAL